MTLIHKHKTSLACVVLCVIFHFFPQTAAFVFISSPCWVCVHMFVRVHSSTVSMGYSLSARPWSIAYAKVLLVFGCPTFTGDTSENANKRSRAARRRLASSSKNGITQKCQVQQTYMDLKKWRGFPNNQRYHHNQLEFTQTRSIKLYFYHSSKNHS